MAPPSAHKLAADSTRSPQAWFRIDPQKLNSSMAGPLLRTAPRNERPGVASAKVHPMSAHSAQVGLNRYPDVSVGAPSHTSSTMGADESTAPPPKPPNNYISKVDTQSMSRLARFSFAWATNASVLCCLIVIIICACMLWMVQMLTYEISMARQELRPIVSAAVPIMRDAESIQSMAVQASRRVLLMVERASNVTELVPPMAGKLSQFIDHTSATMRNVHQLTTHPVLKLDLGSAN